MARPRKVKPVEIEDKEVTFVRPKPQIIDPNFGYPRPAPKPSSMKKSRGRQTEDSDE